MFNLAENSLLLKVVFYWRRLCAALPAQNTDVTQAELYRRGFYERVWEEAAAEVGAQYKQLGFGICELSRNGRVTRVLQHVTAIDDYVTTIVARNKALVYRLLTAEGLPVPRHTTFTLSTLSRAVAFLEKTAAECVVKPAEGASGGEGVTIGIRSPRQLAWAATLAAQCSSEMLVEEQIAGDNYRLLYLDGVLLDAIQHRPSSAVGDGRSTIRQLVEAANAARLAHGSATGPMPITVDTDLQNTLARQGLGLASVPAAGVRIALKTLSDQNFASENITVTDRLCPSIVADGARAAQCVGARLAGIDVITRDPAAPLAGTGGAILEVSTTPGYHYHYHKNDGSFPVAVRVLEQLLADGNLIGSTRDRG